MHLRTNLQWAERPFGRERSLVAALDVEWTKNFRVRGASKPFCYSWSIIDLATFDSLEDQSLLEFGFKSVYLESEDEVSQLLEMIESDIASSRTLSGVTFAGHQLCADLSVLKRSSPIAVGVVGGCEALLLSVMEGGETLVWLTVPTGLTPSLLASRGNDVGSNHCLIKEVC